MFVKPKFFSYLHKSNVYLKTGKKLTFHILFFYWSPVSFPPIWFRPSVIVLDACFTELRGN